MVKFKVLLKEDITVKSLKKRYVWPDLNIYNKNKVILLGKKVQRGDLTFLEEKFRDVIIQYRLYDKYDIVYNYSLYPYFVDFAFTNIKLGVELDGSCHFKYCTRIKHDIERDNLLFEKYNWKMFRIAFNDNWDEKIKELLSVLEKC